jgi:threonine dehydrogenase-like Zn-dependent dehydrogenase
MDDYVRAIELLHERRIDFEPLVTDRVPLQDAVYRGFDALVADPEDHLKILIFPT